MHAGLRNVVSFLLFVQLASGASVTSIGASSQRLNVTAISARNGESTLECWHLDNPFTRSDEPGIVGSKSLSLGDLGNSSLTVLPPRFDGGFHNAPTLQYVVFTTGLAHISLYKGADEVYVQGGKYGLVIAADTADVSKHGHRTVYPSGADTIGFTLPVSDIKHKVLHYGPCHFSELTDI